MRSKRSTLVLLLCYKAILCLLVLLYYHTAKAHVRFLNGNSLEGYTTAGLPLVSGPAAIARKKKCGWPWD